MGIVVRNGSGIRQLLLYREAVGHAKNACLGIQNRDACLQSNDTEEVDVMAVIEGRVVDVRCSICGRVRTWVPLDL